MSTHEEAIGSAWDTRDFRAATQAALEAYGMGIYAMLVGLNKVRADADDAFSMFAERLFVTMSRFSWRCSMRTWSYRLARNANRDLHRASKADRHAPLETDAHLSALVVKLRTATETFLRDEKKEAFARLRDELSDEDRELLVLRVEREMEWLDLARVFLEDEDASEEDLKRESARLRKRFQLVKERLREAGRARGLLGDR